MTVKQRIYVDGFKEQALAKVLGRSDDQSIRSIAADLGMNMGTLRGWMKRALRDQKKPSGKAIASADWTAAQRLLALQESHGLDEEALNAGCRERGIFAHDLTQWRTDFCESTGAAGRREDSEELRQLGLTNMQLQRDLNRKEKALAEAAALLVLQKNIGHCGRPRTYELVAAANLDHRYGGRGGIGRGSAGARLRAVGLQRTHLAALATGSGGQSRRAHFAARGARPQALGAGAGDVARGGQLGRIWSPAAEPDRAATGRSAALYRLRIDLLPGAAGGEPVGAPALGTRGPEAQQAAGGVRDRTRSTVFVGHHVSADNDSRNLSVLVSLSGCVQPQNRRLADLCRGKQRERERGHEGSVST